MEFEKKKEKIFNLGMNKLKVKHSVLLPLPLPLPNNQQDMPTFSLIKLLVLEFFFAKVDDFHKDVLKR